MATLKINSGIHFTKKQPTETHILVSASPSDDSAEYVMDMKTAPPSVGTFETTAVLGDTSGNATHGLFSPAPDGSIAYCNGVTTNVWSGDEARCPAFLVGDSTGVPTTFGYDFSVPVNDTLTTTGHVATLYRASDDKVYIYIGSIRPLQGVKFYVGTPNADTAATVVNYWNGSTWTAVSDLVDGTDDSGVTFAQTGSMTFSSTETLAKLKIIGNRSLYFYQFVITGFSGSTTTVYYCTLDMPMQQPTDIWDGQPRQIASCLAPEIGVTEPSIDYTVNVGSINYVAGDVTTVMAMDGYDGSGGSYTAFGFLERMQGLRFTIPVGNNNAATSTLSYWNGSAWSALTSTDNTSVGGVTFHKTGWITWESPAFGLEQKRSYSGGPLLYYYKWINNAAFSDPVSVDCVQGMPVPAELDDYEIPAIWQNRLVLLSSVKGKKNSALISSYGTSSVFNGADSLYIDAIGDEEKITAAGSVFSRDTNGFYDTLVICKPKETWILDGTTVQNYRLYKISDRHGCVAPHTFRTLQLGLAKGNSRHIAIWQSATGIVAFDGNSIIDLSGDIKNYFERENSELIKASLIDQSVAFVDEREQEYHWLFASGTAATGLNTELVFSFTREAWFRIDRTPQLLCGIPVTSSLGDSYVYGGISTGYLELLEDPTSNTFDGTAITHTFTTRDIPMENWNQQSLVRRVKLVTKANSGVDPTIYHVADGNVSADSTTVPVTITDAAKRIVQGKGSMNWGPAVFHGFSVVVVGNSGTTLFEPVAITGFYQDIRMDI